ncbi:MAG TPA: hydroxyacid dehydrogenase [Gammaproteobacteria bacterium]|nr:hydroxyacid dehydrogenase [Gammaproteobacteria bacterium]
MLRQMGKLVEAPLDREGIMQRLPEFDVLIVRLANQVDRELINAGKHLKVIVSATTGLDHIDIDYAKMKGVTVLSLRGEDEFLRTIHATAEHTWALLLALLRHIPQAYSAVCRGSWDRDEFRGHELDRMRLGIIGLGRLGSRIAHYGLAFGMRVSAYDPRPMMQLEDVTMAPTLDALLASSDVVTVHVHLTEETKDLIGSEELALLPSGAVLVNTSRGEVVNTPALISSLQEGHIAGAALDVVPGERSRCADRKSLLEYARSHRNLLITPHIAGATFESMARTEIFMAKKLVTFLKERVAKTHND